MTKKKREARLAESYESKYQAIALNRSTKLEGKKGFYNGKPIQSRFVLLGDLAKFADTELKDSLTESNGMVSIYGN